MNYLQVILDFIYILRNNNILKFFFKKFKFIENIFINKLKTESRNIKDQIIESTSKNNDIKLKNIFRNYSKHRALKNRRSIYRNIRENNYFKSIDNMNCKLICNPCL